MKVIEKILGHNNSYTYHVDPLVKILSISIIIPCYNSEETINLCIQHLKRAIDYAILIHKELRFEILLIDDFSQIDLSSVVTCDATMKIIRHTKNHGRAHTRNTGLYEAMGELCICIDSDVMVNEEVILEMITSHQHHNNVITCGLFHTLKNVGTHITNSSIQKPCTEINDFRVSCVFLDSWVGLESDKQFVNTHYNLLTLTNNFSKWSGQIGPWILPQMVLGGCFSFTRKQALSVKGFDENFNQYGCEETTLVTKLLVAYDCLIIPILLTNIHIDSTSLKDRNIKNHQYSKSILQFNEQYLHEEYENNFFRLE